MASLAKTASPTLLLTTWWASVRVSSGRPMSRFDRFKRLRPVGAGVVVVSTVILSEKQSATAHTEITDKNPFFSV